MEEIYGKLQLTQDLTISFCGGTHAGGYGRRRPDLRRHLEEAICIQKL